MQRKLQEAKKKIDSDTNNLKLWKTKKKQKTKPASLRKRAVTTLSAKALWKSMLVLPSSGQRRQG